jgi:hypothetical protein
MSAKNNWRVEWKGKQFHNKLDMDIPLTLDTVGRFLRDEVKKTLSQKGTGRIYKTGRSGGTHQASAPGEPPAARTGDLRRRTAYKSGVDHKEFFVKVGNPLPYGPMLEFGTRKMAKRPWLGVTLRDNSGKVKTFLEKGIFR